MDKAKAALRFSIPKHIAQGLENVARVVEEEGVRGCVWVWVGVGRCVCAYTCVGVTVVSGGREREVTTAAVITHKTNDRADDDDDNDDDDDTQVAMYI